MNGRPKKVAPGAIARARGEGWLRLRWLQFDRLNLRDEAVGVVGEESRDDAENGVTEAADVQDVVTVRGLRRRGRLQVDADQLWLGNSQPLLAEWELGPYECS